MTQTIADFPAYRIYKPYDGRKFRHGEKIALPFNSRNHGVLWHFFTLGITSRAALDRALNPPYHYFIGNALNGANAMRNFHNIESRKPLSDARTFPYVGYAASGTKYYATRRHDGRGWRFALAISSQVGEPPYFYVRTMAEASAKLETINGEA